MAKGELRGRPCRWPWQARHRHDDTPLQISVFNKQALSCQCSVIGRPQQFLIISGSKYLSLYWPDKYYYYFSCILVIFSSVLLYLIHVFFFKDDVLNIMGSSNQMWEKCVQKSKEQLPLTSDQTPPAAAHRNCLAAFSFFFFFFFKFPSYPNKVQLDT